MPTLTAGERRNKIVEMLNENGRVTVNELSELFSVSSVAIRTDLSELEHQGMLSRVHGGAITGYKSYHDMNLVQRFNANSKEKKAIAKEINKMIKDNDTIIMNAGTTPIFVMREMCEKHVTIVTNSIALALEGAKNQNFKIILLGGDVDSNYQFTYGVSVIQALEKYTANLLIMSVDGIDPKKGISTFYYQEAEICRAMMKNASKTIVAADYSKLGRTAFAEIDDLSKVNVIVTSNNADVSLLNKIKDKNIKIVVAPEV